MPAAPHRSRARRPSAAGATVDTVREIALALPGVEEGTSYGTPAWKVEGKLLARLREDGETLVVRAEDDARDLLMRSDPETFFVTDHYAGHPWVLVRLPRVERGALTLLIEEAVRLVVPRKALARASRDGTPAPLRIARRTNPDDALAQLRALCLALPEVEERVNHGAPSFVVRGKTFAMFWNDHHGDGRIAAWCKAPPGVQGTLVASDPRRFFVPPYFGPRGWVGVRLDLDPDWGAVEACMVDAHAMVVSKRRTR